MSIDPKTGSKIQRKIGLSCVWILFIFSSLSLLVFIQKGGNPTTLPLLNESESITTLLLSLCFFNLIYLHKLPIYKLIAIFLGSVVLINLLPPFMVDPTDLPDWISPLIITPPERLIGEKVLTLLTSILLVFWPRRKPLGIESSILTIGLLSLILFAFDQLAIQILPIQKTALPVQILADPTMITVYLLLGIGLFSWNLYLESLYQEKKTKWLPLTYGCSVFLFHCLLILGVVHARGLLIESTLEGKAYQMKAELVNRLLAMNNAFLRLSVEIGSDPEFSSDRFTYEGKTLIEHEPGLLGVAWINTTRGVLSSITADGAPWDMNQMPVVIQEKQNLKPPYTFWYLGDNQIIYWSSPIVYKDQVQGCVIGQIGLDQLMQNMQMYDAKEDFIIHISCDNTLITNDEKPAPTSALDSFYELVFSVDDLHFTVKVEPSALFPSNGFSLGLICAIFLGGISGGVLSGLIVYLLQRSKETIITTKKIGERVTMTSEIMEVMNESNTIFMACDKIINILYRYDGWSIFIFWQLNQKTQAFEKVRFATIPHGGYVSFENAINNLSSQTGMLFDAALKSKSSIWCPDLSASNYVLSTCANTSNIRGAIAVPVFQNKLLLGVIELYTPKVLDLQPDIGWLEVMSTLGNQFSFFIERREAHLLDTELNLIIRNSSDAIYKVDLNMNVESWNIGAESLYGWKAEQIIGQPLEVLYQTEYLPELSQYRQKMLNRQVVEHRKMQCKKQNGTLIWVENSYGPIIGEKGEVRAFSIISRDYSQEKAFIEKITASEEKLRLVVNSTQSWIWEMDKLGRFTFSNQASVGMLGYDPSELIGRDWLSLAMDREHQKKQWDISLDKKTGWKNKLWHAQAKNGSILSLESTAEPIFDQRGECSGFHGVDRDVTEELKISTSKSTFLSMVSHELRTPLTSIIGSLGLIKSHQPKGQEGDQELLDVARRNATRLLQLINDILDVEKIGLGKLKLNQKKQRLASIIEDAIHLAEPMLQDSQINIVKTNLLPDLMVYVDAERLIQVIINLISNSIKFSPSHSVIRISMSIKENRARVNVQDSGRGIAYEVQKQIFQPFLQGTSGDTKIKGSGLGLYICKGLIEQMGGEIGFLSEPGNGALFYFDLPISPAKE
jgi:PAS domain S-box-containing protein